jgi:hypothetical protein
VEGEKGTLRGLKIATINVDESRIELLPRRAVLQG